MGCLVPHLASGSLTALSDLHVWLGLQNSDDQGTNFDLRAEFTRTAPSSRAASPVASPASGAIRLWPRKSSSHSELSLQLASRVHLTFSAEALDPHRHKSQRHEGRDTTTQLVFASTSVRRTGGLCSTRPSRRPRKRGGSEFQKPFFAPASRDRAPWPPS